MRTMMHFARRMRVGSEGRILVDASVVQPRASPGRLRDARVIQGREASIEAWSGMTSQTSGNVSTADNIFDLHGRLDDAQIEFLKLEYGNLTQAFLNNEELGERRLTIFVGLIGAATAGVGLAPIP